MPSLRDLASGPAWKIPLYISTKRSLPSMILNCVNYGVSITLQSLLFPILCARLITCYGSNLIAQMALLIFLLSQQPTQMRRERPRRNTLHAFYYLILPVAQAPFYTRSLIKFVKAIVRWVMLECGLAMFVSISYSVSSALNSSWLLTQ